MCVHGPQDCLGVGLERHINVCRAQPCNRNHNHIENDRLFCAIAQKNDLFTIKNIQNLLWFDDLIAYHSQNDWIFWATAQEKWLWMVSGVQSLSHRNAGSAWLSPTKVEQMITKEMKAMLKFWGEGIPRLQILWESGFCESLCDHESMTNHLLFSEVFKTFKERVLAHS